MAAAMNWLPLPDHVQEKLARITPVMLAASLFSSCGYTQINFEAFDPLPLDLKSIAEVEIAHGSELHVNPIFSLPSEVYQSSFSIVPKHNQIDSTREELVEFSAWIEDRFSYSNLHEDEATQVHRLLEHVVPIEEGSCPEFEYETLEDFRERILVRKLAANTFELFYSERVCGSKVKGWCGNETPSIVTFSRSYYWCALEQRDGDWDFYVLDEWYVRLREETRQPYLPYDLSSSRIGS